MNTAETIEYQQKEIDSLKKEISSLKEQLEWFTRQVFGKRSEKITHSPQENYLFELPLSTPLEKQQEVCAHKRIIKKEKSDKLTFPENLPVERTVIDLKEEEIDGKPLVKIGEEITQKLAYRPGSYYIKEIIRPKYAVSKDGESTIITAKLPDSIIARSKADESFLADILVKKFADHLPLYRQCEILLRENIGISRQILSQWVVKCGFALKPLFNKMLDLILESKNIFIDEVPVDMLSPGKGSVQQTYMWVVVGDQQYQVYNFRTDRRHKHAEEILKGFGGFVHSDKYGAYEKLASHKEFIWCPCWAHIRRKFFEAEGGDPKFRSYVLRKIKYLFMLERVGWNRSAEERLRIRQEKEVPIIDELIERIKDRLINGKILAKSKFKEALGYFCSLIPYLKNFTKNPKARLDNNVAERAVRPIAIGRKNWLFLGSEEGGEAAGIILSLVQTCRALNINPREYLEDIMRRIMSHPINKIEELLPDKWAKATV